MALNFFRVNDSSNISVGKNRGWESKSSFDFGVGFAGSKDGIELLEGGFSPKNESTNVSSRGELKKIQSEIVSKKKAN